MCVGFVFFVHLYASGFIAGQLVFFFHNVSMNICSCTCRFVFMCECVHICIIPQQNNQCSKARRKDSVLLVIQNYSTSGKERLMEKKSVSWDLHVYVVCKSGRYLGIVAVE